uniref:Probable tRNA(His) guanylyltransferase n=1 Tax=Glossina pallidipes TaxID=7398 RepID=A0A1B0AFI2_GLOPL
MKLALKFLPIIKATSFQLRNFRALGAMACSRYEYVKNYEVQDVLLPNVWIIIRIDGKGFHKFSLNLMTSAAQTVMEKFSDIILSYGQKTNVYNRRSSKLLSYVTSLFTSCYVMYWPQWMGNQKLTYPPSFDGRVVLYPSDQNLRDYLSWRQADVHINNLYNTAFWNLVQKKGLTNKEAEAKLRGTYAAYKNELLFSEFGINYNNLPGMFRKGTILLRKQVNRTKHDISKQLIVPFHEDMISDIFWKKHSELLADKYSPGLYTQTDDDVVPESFIRKVEKISVE